MNKFEGLGLSQPTVKAVAALGFEEPTLIQEKAIPLLLENKKDFIGLAQTGTGKTAAFGLPLMDLVDTNSPNVQALILAPTRELCMQISKQIEAFAKFDKKLKTLAVYGGADIVRQIKTLKKGVHIIAATPGRLRDLIKRKAANLEDIQFMVLDEADEMLNMGFREEIDEILEGTPESKRVWLFSATMSKDVKRITKNYMTKPDEITVGQENAANLDITHTYTLVRPRERYEVLKRFISAEQKLYGIVFCRTRRDTVDVARDLSFDGFKAEALNGDLSQAARDRVMERFKRKNINILVATDVAARGIDVDEISHVFHYNIPEDINFYTHRSGRTGRAGKKGFSIILAHPKDKRILRTLENRINAPIQFVDVPSRKAIFAKKLNSLVEDIKRAKPIKEVESLMGELNEQTSNLSKEDLLRQIVYLTLEKEEKLVEIKKYKESDSGRERGGGGRGRGGSRGGRSGFKASGKNPFHKKKARKKFERSKKKKKKKAF